MSPCDIVAAVVVDDALSPPPGPAPLPWRRFGKTVLAVRHASA